MKFRNPSWSPEFTNQSPQFNHMGAFKVNEHHPLHRGMLVWYLMNEGGGTRINSLPTNYPGNFTGNRAWTRSSPGFCMTGSTGQAGVVYNALFRPAAISISVWAKATANAAWQFVYVNANKVGASDRGASILVNPTTNQARFGLNWNTKVSQATVTAWGGWHHYVGTYSVADGYVRLYVDGVPATPYADVGGITYESVEGQAFGADLNGGAPINGSITNGAIYNRVLTANEAKELYYHPFGTPENPRFIYKSGKIFPVGSGVIDPVGTVTQTLENATLSATALQQPVIGSAYDVADCDLWLKGEDLIGADSDAISTWADASGHGNDLTGTTTTRPLKKSTGTFGLNNQPTARADGVDDILSGGYILDYTGRSGLTIIAVIHHALTANDSSSPIIGRDTTGADGRGWELSVMNTGDLRFFVPSSSSAGASRDSSIVNLLEMPAIVRGRYNGATEELSVWINGVSQDGTLSGAVPASIGNNGTILKAFGTYWTVSDTNFKGDIAEIIVFNRALTDGECEAIEAELITKYNLYVFEETRQSPDTACHQGVIFDGTYNYTLDTNKIQKRNDSDWSVLATNSNPTTGLSTTHCNPGCVADGLIYIGASDYPTNNPVVPDQMMVFNASDLSRISANSIDIAYKSYGAWAIDAANGYLIGHISAVGGIQLHRYDIDTLALVDIVECADYPTHQLQGIVYRDGKVWGACGVDAGGAEGLIILIDPDWSSGTPVPTARPIFRRKIGNYSEGIEFTYNTLRWMVEESLTDIVHVYEVTGEGITLPPSFKFYCHLQPKIIGGGIV
jgi:hypothetical protein